jgi:transketolase
MRAAFVETLRGLAEQDERILLLTGDLGFMVVERFAAAHPSRFINVGVAEANMLGLATGLAEEGFLPFCYSIATFASLRGYEQLRNGGVLHQLPVRLVGVGGGLAYGSAGRTHHALEDIGLMRLQPQLAVIAPADDAQTEAALRATYAQPGPIYYRVGKDSTSVPELGGRFAMERVETVGGGADVLFITAGVMTASVIEAARCLEGEGVGTTVAVVAAINPPPLEDLRRLLSTTGLAVTVEDHYVSGGLGSLVAEVIAEHRLGTPLLRRGVAEPLPGRSGSEAYLRQAAGLSVAQLVEAVRAARRPAPHPSVVAPAMIASDAHLRQAQARLVHQAPPPAA